MPAERPGPDDEALVHSVTNDLVGRLTADRATTEAVVRAAHERVTRQLRLRRYLPGLVRHAAMQELLGRPHPPADHVDAEAPTPSSYLDSRRARIGRRTRTLIVASVLLVVCLGPAAFFATVDAGGWGIMVALAFGAEMSLGLWFWIYNPPDPNDKFDF